MIDNALELNIPEAVVDKNKLDTLSGKTSGVDELLKSLRSCINNVERIFFITFKLLVYECNLFGEFFMLGKGIEPV